MEIEQQEPGPLPGEQPNFRLSTNLLCHLTLFIMVVLMLVTSNPIFAFALLILYVSVLYTWEKIFRKPWLSTEAERNTTYAVVKGQTFQRASLCKFIFGSYLLLAKHVQKSLFHWTGTGWCENSTRWKSCKQVRARSDDTI